MSNKQLEMNKILDNLSPKEREMVLSMMQEFADSGSSSEYDKLLYNDYKEIPVDIETFLTNDNYLGKAWKDVEGKLKIYPFWINVLKNLFPTNTDTNYDTLLESGARGIGKSEIACGCVCSYLMYRVMCLKNPLEFYHLKPTEKIVFAFMNIKLDLAESIATDKFQKTIQMSPWFMSKGSITQRNNQPFWNPPDPIKLIIGSQSDDIIGLPVYYAFFDEISFIRNQDIDKQKKKAKDMIDTAIGGMMTRFIHQGKNPTMLVVASSKRSEQSFMEQYIKTLSQNETNNVYVVDKPVWEVKPKGTYSDKTFNIGLGNKWLESVVIADNENIDDYRAKGYQIIKVPIDFKAKAKEDLERMLCDFAGISSVGSNKYMSAKLVNKVIDESIKNPFPDIVEVGTGDSMQYKQFFNLDNVPKELLSKPLYIHLDMSISGDMTGIAGVWIIGKKITTDGQSSKDLSFRLAFSTSVKSPKGHQISFEKNREFIRWLKSVGFNIKEISSDTFQSYDLQQQLKSEGFTCSILSVDRVDTDHICKPYQYLKSTISEERFKMYKSDRLFDEFIDIERNMATGKVDHTPNGHKDALDAVCGATFTASKHAEEFAYDYGESLNVMIDVNSNKDDELKSQITVDFEEELKNASLFNSSIMQEQKQQSNQNNSNILEGAYLYDNDIIII